MARTDNLDHFLTDVADAIRTKTGSAATIAANQFDTAIVNIPSGGGSPTDYFDGNGAHYTDTETNFFKVDYVISTTNFPDIDCTGYTSLQNFFSGCYWKKLPRVKNTTTATDLGNMFENCYFVTTLDLSQMNTSNVTNMNRMFYNCNALTSLDISNFDLTKVTNLVNAFAGLTSATTINLGTSSTPALTGAEYMIQNANKVTTIDLSHFDFSKIPSTRSMFATSSQTPTLQTIMLPAPNTNRFFSTALTGAIDMFTGQKELTTVNNLADFPFDNVTNVSNMFNGCSKLIFPDPFVINASSLGSITQMFLGCSKLGNVTFEHLKTDLYMEKAFNSCFKEYTTPEITIKFVADNPAQPHTVILGNYAIFYRAFDNTRQDKPIQKLVLEFDHMALKKETVTTSSSYQTFNQAQLHELVIKGADIGPSLHRLIGYMVSLNSIKFENCTFTNLTAMNNTFDVLSASYYNNLKTIELPGLTGVGVTFTNTFVHCTGLEKLDIRDMLFSGGVNTNILGNDIPNNCLIIVKDATEKAALQTGMPRFTNIMTVAEYEAQ